MSYDIELCDPVTGKVIEFDAPHRMEGGTHCVGGTRDARLNVTYNYAKFFYKTIDGDKGIRFIYGMTGAEAIPVLEKAIQRLGDDADEDYWKPTEGNAKRSLLQLVALAKLRPDGIFRGD